MKQCPYCAHNNREGFLFCEECGQRLKQGDTSPTLPTKRLETPTTQNFPAPTIWGTTQFEKDSTVIIHIRDAPEPLTFKPKVETILGRGDASSPHQPDLDLTPYGAMEKGVSRVHASICRDEDTLTLIDRGSANGTHLNGQRLVPNQARVLRDGDEIRLGKLVAHIYFKPRD